MRPDQVRLVSGETDVSPSEYFTSGSYSVSVGGAAIRLVCAEVRAMLTDKVAEALALQAQRAVRSRKGNSCAAARRPAATTGRWRPHISLDRRASGTAPTKSPSKYKIVGTSLPRLDLPAKVKGAAFIHDIAVEGVVHARMLRQPWKGARLASLDEAAVRKAAEAPIDIIRDGEFVAFTGDDELAVTRAAEAARQRANGRAARRRPITSARRNGSRRSRRAQPHRRAGRERPRSGPHRHSALLAAIPHLRLDRAVLRARRIQGRRAEGVVAHPRALDPARLARQGARPGDQAGHGVPSPGRRRLRPQHRRRLRVRRLLYRDEDAGTHRARAVGRARTSSCRRRSAPRWRSSSPPCSAPTTSRPTGRSKSGARRTRSGPA